MKLAIAGASGFIGSALVPFLQNQGHLVYTLVREKDRENESNIFWDPKHYHINAAKLEGLDGVINLSGENIAKGRWTAALKKEIRESRILSTNLLVDAISRCKTPPKVLINSSAIGIYGDRGDEELTEQSYLGNSFLAEVCKDWEKAAERAASAGIRVVCLRTGVVLSHAGGALKKMLLPFKLGFGGILGSGKQYLSWIALEDFVNIINFSLDNPAIEGPVNAVGPEPVTNYQFTKTLGSVLHRPTILPVPSFMLRLLLGEMADALLLSSERVVPQKLLQHSFPFKYKSLKSTLEHYIKA